MTASSRTWASVMVPPSSSRAPISSDSRSSPDSPSAPGRFRRRLDDAEDHLVDLARRGLELPVRRRRHPGGRLEARGQAQDAPELLHQLRDDVADVAGVGRHVGAEQRLGDDVQRHRHHVLVDVAHLAGLQLAAARAIAPAITAAYDCSCRWWKAG